MTAPLRQLWCLLPSSNLSPIALDDPSSGSYLLCPHLQCPLCPPSDLSLGSSVLCPCLSGRPQVLTLESEHLGDQIRHGSSGQFWVTPGWGGGRAGAAPNLGSEQISLAPQELNPPHCRDPFPTSFTGPLSSQPALDAGNQVREGKGVGLDIEVPLTYCSPQAACLLSLPCLLFPTGPS